MRFGATRWLDSLGPYSSYLFEVLILALFIFIDRRQKRELWNSPSRPLLSLSLLSLCFGALMVPLAVRLEILIPFDFSNLETLVLLLVVAPLLEEFIFRYFLWAALERWGSVKSFLLTTILFSYAHLHAIWFLPNEFYPFIYFQTAYTLMLGALCGFAVWRYRSLPGAILIHFFFNLGFYLAARF